VAEVQLLSEDCADAVVDTVEVAFVVPERIGDPDGVGHEEGVAELSGVALLELVAVTVAQGDAVPEEERVSRAEADVEEE
jgi:hypothetical protein